MTRLPRHLLTMTFRESMLFSPSLSIIEGTGHNRGYIPAVGITIRHHSAKGLKKTSAVDSGRSAEATLSKTDRRAYSADPTANDQ